MIRVMPMPITLVCDNLNPYDIASLYKAYEPDEALRLVNKLELIHTPNTAVGDIVECELSMPTRQC